MEGFCECGCGRKTWVATLTNTKHGWVKGKAVRFCKGHWSRTNKAAITRRIGAKVGDEHPMWKGGRIKTAQGYIAVYAPSHHRAKSTGKPQRGYVLEHILIAEQKYGRSISYPQDIVHHLNGVKTDNRPENLAVVTRNNHSTQTLRSLMAERIRELELRLKETL
jgi:hypothetical protein